MPAFSIFRKSKPSSDKDTSSPPPYRESAGPVGGESTEKTMSKTPTRIQATDTPQWEWSTSQCQAWFYEFLISKLDYAPEAAGEVAGKLDGFGPNIYSRTVRDWRELLGHEQGEGIYSWLLGVRRQEGAIPRNLGMSHGGRSGTEKKR